MNTTNTTPADSVKPSTSASNTASGKPKEHVEPYDNDVGIETLSPSEISRLITLQRSTIKKLANRLAESETKLESIRYKLGGLVADALRQRGGKLLRLPADLITLWRERSAADIEAPSRPKRVVRSHDDFDVAKIGEHDGELIADKPEDTILFLPINGTGLGHLTRCLAVANHVQTIAPEKQIIFLTTSIALPILFQQEYLAYYVPPRAPFEHLLSHREWNQLFENAIDDIIRIHHPGTIVFDGTYPYEGLRWSLQGHKSVKSIWIKRGLYRTANLSDDLREYMGIFDHILVPGELSGKNADPDRRKTTSVSPIVYMPPEGQLSKADACRTLRLDPNMPIAYIQLGAGNINDITEQTQRLIDILNSEFPEMQLVFGESPISRSRLAVSGRFVLLRDYPNSKYFGAFDLAILAAGYNSVYESLFYELPTVFLPRMVGTDNQLERARLAEQYGIARVCETLTPDTLVGLVSEVLANPTDRPKRNGSFANGAVQAARCIVEVANPAS